MSRQARLTFVMLPALAIFSALLPGIGRADSQQATVGVAVAPARLELGLVEGSAPVQTTFDVTNTGPAPLTVKVELADLVVNSTGAYQALPAGSTPYSLGPKATLDHASLALGAAGGPLATGHVVLTIVVEQATRPRYGGLLVTPDITLPPRRGSGGFGVQVTPRILVPLIAAPLGQHPDPAQLAGGNYVKGSPESLKLEQASRSWADRVIPIDLPHVADHAPLSATSRIKNSGNTFAHAISHFEFTSLVGSHVFLRADPPPQPTFPGTVASSTQTTTVENQGNSIETAPPMGVVKVHVTTRTRLLDANSEPVDQEEWIVIFPWKEALLAAVALVVVRFIWRRIRRRQENR